MKSKVRSTLLLVVLFVLAVSALFAAPPQFTPANITAVPATGNLTIGSTITITVVDINNITVPANQFASAKVDLTQLGGPAEQPMVKVSNAPGQGQWRATYTVALGNIDGVANRMFSVTATNPDGSHTEQYPQGYTVDNVPSMNNVDFTGNPYLRIGSSNATELMKVGDTVTLIANFKPYIEKVWVNWGATFSGAPEIEYTLVSGALNASFTPASGTLPGGYNDDLSIVISKMQSISNSVAGPYMSAPGWNRVVSKNLAGFQIAADLNPPSMIGAWDLFYNVSALTHPSLRFSPASTTVDGYTTLPNTFKIYLKLPGWGTLGGPTQFTVEFASENRFTPFQKTFSIMDSPATVLDLGGGLLEADWNGKNASGQVINPTLETTVGITLVDVKDYVGNSAELSRDPDNVGVEFPDAGDVLNPADHAFIHHGGEAHVGLTIQNRIHVVVDNVAPGYVQQPALVVPENVSVTRLINDENNNGVWDALEQVYYNNSAGNGISSVVDFKFQTSRTYTADSNPLRYEDQYYWLFVEKEGSNPVERWYWTGFSWAPIGLFDQTTDFHSLSFTVNPDGGGANISDEEVIHWDLGTLNSTIFTGATGAGTTYKVTAYLQDNSGNVVRSNQALQVTISSIYMNIPFVNDVNIISQHTTAAGGLPVTTGGVKNFYLDANYSDDPNYTGPLSGPYYDTQDEITIEIEVNNRDFLRATNSVELRFNQLGIPNPQIKYLNRNQFGINNKATITIPASSIPISKAAIAPGEMWEVGGANGVSNYIQVISHAIEYTVNGSTFSQEFDALDSDLFNLIIPPAPDFPDPNWSVYQLAVTEPSFSPGNPLNTYDAIANPANDDMKDTTDFSFTIPNGSNITWKLEISDSGTPVRSWTNHLGVGDTPYISGPITFNGLSTTLQPIATALATKNLTATLYIEPDPMGDPGYLPPPPNIHPNIPVKVDNTNPALVSNLVSGTGTSINSQRKITVYNNNVEDIKVVTQTQNELSFTVRSSEALSADLLQPNTWQAMVRKSDNTPIINDTDPLNPITVEANVTEVIASPDNMTFNVKVEVNNLAGTVTHQNAILILRLPWDDASNPGRYNVPAYPYNADVWHQDSAEYYLTFNILDAKPRIDWVKFSHRGLEGEANYNLSDGQWNPNYTQAWVGPWIATPTAARDFTLTAQVSGGAYRDMHTDWTADLSSLLGPTYTAVEPDTSSVQNVINEYDVWTLTWTGQISQAIANGFTNNATLPIAITITTRDGSSPIAHQEVKLINLKVDKAPPTVINAQTAIVADGTAKPYTLTVNDTNGSGVYWDPIPVVPTYIVADNQVLTPYPTPVAPDGITQVSTGNGTYTITMPETTAIKHFQAQYVVMDRMGNQTTYNRYLNVDPLPILSNVKINSDTTWFVPGNSLTVTWNLTNAQRATGGLLTLSAPGVTLTSYDRNLTAAQLQAGTYTYTGFYQNNTALDGKTLTATVTGWTTGYANAANATPSNRNFTLNQNTDTILVDTKPVINSVIFKLNGNVINTLAPNTAGLTIEAVVTSPNPLDAAQTTIDIAWNAIVGAPLTGVFDFGGANPTITTNGNTKTIVWNNVSVSNLLWTPLTDLGVARFVIDTKTIYGYAATTYMHDMALMKDPVAVIQGKTGRDPYAGIDPDGWFAPEHFLHTAYTFISNVDVTGTPVIPPVTADYDLIEDNINDNWREVNSTSTKTTVSKTLVRGLATTSTINVNAYKYVAKWVISPDVQSIWSAYNDGAAIDIDFKYKQYTFIQDPVLDDDKFIKVDKNVPKYDNFLEIATGTATAPGSWQLLQNGFPNASTPISVALDPTSGSWPANTYLYVKFRAIDGAGAGARHVVNPTNANNWAVSQHSQTATAGVLEKIIRLNPSNNQNVTASSILNLVLGTVQDSVGHVNYGAPTNSTDPNWLPTPPVISFNFRSDYATTHEYIRAFKYLEPNRQDWTTSPYVQAGEEIGVMLKLNPVVPDRGTDVDYIEILNVQLNPRYITNVTGGSDTWITLNRDIASDVWYLNDNVVVNPNYTNNAGISMQYRINYSVHYTNGDTYSPPPYVSAVIPNVGIVDKEAPQFIFDGSPTNPLNQRSVFFWSGSIGPTEEGYVVPGDNDGQLRLIFKDSSGYENTNTTPIVKITNLDEFVTGMPQDYTVPATKLGYHTTYSISVNNTTYNYTNVWVASLDSLSIYAQVPPIYSTTIGYAVTDVVGNGPASGDRYVEIAADGPIVPIIRHAELVSTVPGTNGQVYNYLAQNVPATMKVYIHTQHSAFIEDVYIDPITGVQYLADSTPVAIDVNDPLNHNANWLVTIPVNPNNVNNYDNINFVVHTKRHPYGAPVFTGTKEVSVVVDGKDFTMDAPTITGVGFENINGMLGPKAAATITVQFNNIGEQIVEDGVTSLPAGIENWFSIQNLNPAAFNNIPTPDITIDGADVLATWTFTAADINQSIAQNISQLSFKVAYQDIWGHTADSNWNFNFDQKPPVISTGGITFYNGDTLIQTANYNGSPNAPVANNTNWTKVRFTLNDPLLRTGVPGSGIHYINVSVAREAETYTPSPDPLANMTATYNPAGYFELAFNPGFSAFDLAEGYYNFTISTDDNLMNDAVYTQRFLYWHQPTQMEISPSNGSTIAVLDAQGNINQQQITAFPYDPNGQVQAVQFFLYEDVNNNGLYEAGMDVDLTAHLENDDNNMSAIDNQAPYTVMWDLNKPAYKYLINSVYNRNHTRKFLVRASAISEGSRAVSDSIIVINVRDNQPPVPNTPVYTGNTEFDYIVPANNEITLSTGFAPEWIDAEWAIFEIYRDGALVATRNAMYSGGVADTTWSYNGLTPGNYTVTVKGKDFVGNVSPAVNMTDPITITNPASNISYNLGMTNVLGFNNEPEIPDNAVYGFNNPATAVGNLRLDANFFNINTMAPSLAGISSITFKARVTNNITGAVSTVNVPNNTTLQPDYPASGPIAVTPQMWNNTVSIFVPDSFYMPAGYDANDFSYEFFIELTPTNPAVLQATVYSTIRLDYFAPRVTITENTPNITWSRNNLFKVTGDITDINNVVLKWSSDNSAYHDAVYGNLAFNTLPNTTHYAQFENWNTAGGSVETLLNYAGPAWLKVVATDAMGNMRESAAVQVFVDNVAPNTPVTHVAYRSHPDNESQEDPLEYANLHALGSLYGETPNTITAVTSTQDYGTSTLRIYVDPAQMTNLSAVALNDPNFNTNASWYTGTNDFRPPVRLYHGYSATGDIDNITWTGSVWYDHEPLNGLYGFDIPSTQIQASGTHYFILGSSDTRGNVEGDMANNGIPAALTFDGILSAAEKKAAIDLIVNVINVADVKAEIVSHVDNQIVGEWINLAANVTENIGNVPVNQVRFEYKVNNTWTEIATVASAPASNVKFHLYREDIPAYDGLPFVPGVHLYANGTLVSEMMWNATHECWEYTANLTQMGYNFQYRLDLNNDGVISSLDLDVANLLGTTYIINDPNGFTSFNVTPWVTPLNTETIAAGIYEFRALPLAANGSVLFNQVAPSRWIHIDNNAPNTAITVIGGVQRIRPLIDPVTITADVNELLVAVDDIVEVMYQYSSQPAAAPVRRWVQFGTQVNMGGNYRQPWMAPVPLADLVDNDNDGLVDEADEADATYYLRAVTRDKAGNYFTSNVYTMFVDGSAPQMLVEQINGVLVNATNNIFEIPTSGPVVVTATNITPDYFDDPVLVSFEYCYKDSVAAAWGGWQKFDPAHPWIAVTGNTATAELPFVSEGYYKFRATAKDALGNTDSASPETYVVFDDVNGSNARITQVGNRNVVSGQYAFANVLLDFGGDITATIDFPAEINTVTFEWKNAEADPWININTLPTDQVSTTVSTPWTPQSFGADNFAFVRIVAQDMYGNNESEQTVKLFLDTTAPGAAVISLTYNEVAGYKWLNNSEAVALNISYLNPPETGLVDVASATVSIVNVANGVNISETYANTGQASVNFTFSAADMATLTDGIYRLEIVLTDFAGNTATILPADYQALYIDTMAPAGLAMVSTSHPNYIAVYNENAINFEITYNDLIGVAPTGDMTATFTYQDAIQTVSEYTLDTVNNKISFTWDPNDSFQDYIINGEMNILVSAEVKVFDLLDHYAIVPGTTDFFTLTYGIPGTTRLMAVTDVVNGNRALHYVNWNLPTPQVAELVGTNHTANAQPLELYAYVPHLSEIPTSVDFSFRLLGTQNWTPIATDINGEMWNFIDPSFLAQYQRQYSVNWDIASLIGGVYEVQITSHYPVANSNSVAIVNIYNGTIVPQVAVPSMVNGAVQRGETYTVNTPSFTGNMDFLSQVSYQYRYVNVENNVVSPVSQWMNFGDVNGNAPATWISEPYSFDWTVYPYYLYNNTIQIVAFAKDKWGTETPITSILSANAYTLARIIDTQAPDAAISYTWMGKNNPEWVSGLVNPNMTIKATITSDLMLGDLASVEFKFNGSVIGTVNAPLQNNIAMLNWTGLPADAATTTGILQVVTYDVYGNMNDAATHTLNIDNVLPTANFVLPATVDRGTDLVLNANAADAPAGILNVEFTYAQNPVPAQPWNAIATVIAAPWTYEWTVPANLEFGATYTVQAKITDLVGNVWTTTSEFTVTDPETPMQILSVAGHAPVNNIIPVRLHDDVTIETAVNDVNIMRVEYVIRNSDTAPWTHLEYADVVAGRADIVLSDILPDFAAGNWTLGVRAREARETLGNISASVQVTLDHSLTIGQIVSMPANNGFFNGTAFTVNFTVTSNDELDANSIALEYRVRDYDGANDWHAPVITSSNLDRTGANTYVATFTGVEIYHTPQSLLNGKLDFRFSVSDLAAETPNIARQVITNVMYDTTDPEVIFTGITGTGVTEVMGSYNIQLASTATITGNTWDVLYGQISQVASGIDKVELWYNYNGTDVLIGTQTNPNPIQIADFPVSFTWNTTGLSVGTYNLGMMAYDKAGNVNGAAMTVNIVPPAGWEPYALITAMSFDGDNANQDTIHAVVDRWNNEVIDQVAFEYLVGTTWTQFAAVLNPVPAQFTVSFNAELMSAATKIRSVVTYNGGIVSTSKPELSIAYSTAEGGSLTVVQPSINANVFYNNELRITGAASAPRATVLFNGSLQSTPAVQMVNGTQTAFFTVPNHGVYKLWASAINYDNWTMQLNGATLNTYNIGTVASNGISTTVPAGNFVYFENVAPSVVLPTGFTGLSAQNAVIASPQGNLDYSVTLTTTPATNGTVVGMYYDGNQWTNVPATVTGNVATFTAPSGYIYAVAQYTGTAFNVVFSAIDPQYVSGTTLWTVADPTSIKFFVYDGMTQGGYTSPAIGDITWQMYIDDVAVASTYVNGYITAVASDLAAGAHTASVVVTMNDVEVTAEKAFNVETTQPVIVATGTQLTVSNRTISASITDPQTGILDAHLYAYNSDDPTLNITVPMENLVVAGNTYSYTFTMDDLNALGYDVNYTMPMNVVWYAANPLMPAAVTEPINYTVNIEGPAIAFTGFANGWWLNPTFTTPLTFTVTVPQGRTMPTDGVSVSLDEVTPNGNNNIQNMTLAPISVAGNVYSYSFNFGQLLSPAATAVKLNVYAIDNYNVYNMSEQTYGIDMAAPVLWAMAPVGAPIDNDGDGLFNEDVPNGVNEDLDWVDLDQDGFWDVDEPQIIDEDPIDFQDAVITQGTNVVIALGFEDYSSFQYLLPGGTTWYYTGQSGINAANIQVSLNGAPITGTVTNGTFTHNAGMLEAGHYTVVASVPDHVGNVGGLAFEFDVVGGAPTIVFNPIDGNGWWINSTEANVLTFNVNYDGEMADGGVVANIYAEPGNTLIQGPITPTPNQNVYSISLLGGVVPAGSYAVRLEVAATTAWGITSTSNQTYGIDNNAPVITLTSPAENAQFNINATVNIMASISDMVATRLANVLRSSNDSKDRPAGSGIEAVTLSVINPNGEQAFDPITYPANTQVINKAMPATVYGTYIINLMAKDYAGNQSMISRNFMVTPNTAPTVSFTEIAWLNSVGTNNLSFTVDSVVPVSVVANVFTQPSNALLMGPLTVNSPYNVALNGSMIPMDQNVVRLQVIVSDQYGNVTEANHYYNVDRIAPEVMIISPVEGVEITLVDETTAVNILAQFTDAAGSGIAGSSLVVVDPLGVQVGVATTTPADVTETSRSINDLMLGTYIVRLTVTDKAGNQQLASVSFTVIAAPLPPTPPVDLEITDAHAYPNPMLADGTGKISLMLNTDAHVNVRIYDFAGREVRSMDYNGKVMAKAATEIVFDGRNNQGVKLARGTYFARVIANDGKKIVEKVVKIAIK